MAISTIEARINGYSDQQLGSIRQGLRRQMVRVGLDVATKTDIKGVLRVALALVGPVEEDCDSSLQCSSRPVEKPSGEDIRSFVTSQQGIRRMNVMEVLDTRLDLEQRRRELGMRNVALKV